MFSTINATSSHAHAAEVEVDPDTGEVTVLRYVVAQDVGRAVNPAMIAGQVDGAVAQGVGYALYEDLRIGPDGQVLDQGLETYRIPTALDVPPIDLEILESPLPNWALRGQGRGRAAHRAGGSGDRLRGVGCDRCEADRPADLPVRRARRFAGLSRGHRQLTGRRRGRRGLVPGSRHATRPIFVEEAAGVGRDVGSC